MRPGVVLAVLIVLLVGVLLAFREARLARSLRGLEVENARLAEALKAATNRIAAAEARLGSVEARAVEVDARLAAAASAALAVPPATASSPAAPGGPAFAVAMSGPSLSGSTSAEPSRGPRRVTVPEYDPTQPPPPEPEPEPAPPPPTAPAESGRRSWGQEQIVGAPDTERAGDVPTAWASREPDGGPEWLQAGFDRDVEVAEVRIRETYNPGAINLVTAMVGGTEVVLWEGTASGGSAPRDFVVRPPFAVSASAVVVHLDTKRVPGWNEIDAVELVGRDGSRQWATSAEASSTYADRHSARFEMPAPEAATPVP